MSLNGLWKTALGAAALAMACGASAAPKGIAVSVVPEKHALGQEDDVVVSVTVTNTSDSPQYLLKWRTPFEGVDAPLFDVKRDGEPVPYLGALVKRGAPKQSDYFLLKPGASHTVKVELSALYDMSVTGDYQISYKTASPDLFWNGHGKDMSEMASEAATVWVDGRLPRGATPQAVLDLEAMKRDAANPSPSAGSLSFSKCTTTQQTTITQALSAGLNMATNSDAYMSSGAPGPRYTKWFGATDSARVNRVKANFAAIKDAFANKPVTVDCGCKKTYYAYVYPTQPYTIYVCKAFWSAPLTGTDSKGGTLLHEMSHFNVVAGTDDHAYGQAAAANLAITNPALAVENADSHEYFGENTPALQ
ncbi:M35 family metallo-endopeptidase [Massilia niastensis]|uniref:M35 family metallo-endopeptidase n=1 Tax=Massilia niastensis TaxID=544911 RepID=UPI0003AAD051|nr:M35 family metallo-endopeptidase [Massilia niastensis]